MSTEFDMSFTMEAFDSAPYPESLAGVLFAEDFDLALEPPPTATAPAEPGPQVYEESQVLAARLQSYEDGRSAGLGEATARAKLAEEAALHSLSKALAGAQSAATDAASSTAQKSARVMMTLLAAALPEFCARHGDTEARALAEALLPMLSQQPRIVLRANPRTIPCLEQIVARNQGDTPGRISMVATDALENGDIAIEWQDGSASRDTTKLRRALTDLLAPLGLSEQHASAKKELEDVE